MNLAKRLAKVDKLKMGSFLQYWGFENFREEDYNQNISKDGKTFPSLVEESLQLALKAGIHNKDIKILANLIPFSKKIVNRFPDNQWLPYYLGKALVMAGCREDAVPYCKSICMAKINDFWTWELLGDALAEYPDQVLACYSKALMLPSEDVYTSNLRLKTALLLAKLGYYSEAKHEFEMYALLKPDKLPQSAQSQIASTWYNKTIASSSNEKFFMAHAVDADEILLADLSWHDAVIGYNFTVERDKGQEIRWRIYFLSSEKEFRSLDEASCKAVRFPFCDFNPGTPIKIKGIYLQNGSFRILSFSLREEGQPWDIFKEQRGVILYVNESKNLYHAVIDGPIDIAIPFSFFDEILKPGDFVIVKLFTNHKGHSRPLQAQKTEQTPGHQIFRRFEKESLRISGGPGFTDSGIFIPPDMVVKYHLTETLIVSGFAVLNYERKKLRWSWRALDMDFSCEEDS